MARRILLECEFLIPLHRDRILADGRAHPPEAWVWLRQQLFAFGGGGRYQEAVEGWYLDPDTDEVVWDTSWRYFVALTPKKVRRLRSMLVEACHMFAQKCIYLSIAGHVEFIQGRDNEQS